MKNVIWVSAVVLAMLLGGCGGVKQVQSETLAKTSQSWDGSLLPAYPDGTPEVTILRITIPPHAQLDMHKHLVNNMGVLTEGELTVVAQSGKVLYLHAGEAIVELVDQWHYGRNDGDTNAEIIVVYAGAQGKPITVKKDQAN